MTSENKTLKSKIHQQLVKTVLSESTDTHQSNPKQSQLQYKTSVSFECNNPLNKSLPQPRRELNKSSVSLKSNETLATSSNKSFKLSHSLA